MHHTKNKRY
ncbi:hypothetical protein YPPY05_0413, partial [Yersinia pestis PY-05]